MTAAVRSASSSQSAWHQRGLRCKHPEQYVRPKKPIDQFTAQEASDFLDWYAATTGEREAQSNSFYNTAAIWLGIGFLAVPLMVLASALFSS